MQKKKNESNPIAKNKKTKKTRTPSQRGKASRNKGKTFEREVAAALREVYGEGIRRGWQTRAGDDAADIEGAPWFVECKHHARVNIRAAWMQVEDAQTGARTKKNPAGDLRPLLIAKDTGRETLAILRFDDFLELLKMVELPRETPTQESAPTAREVQVLRLVQPRGF